MKNAKKYLIVFSSALVLSISAHAQLGISGFIEYGYAIAPNKSDELLEHMSSYNSYFSPESPYDLKIKSSKGTYLKFGMGVGAEVQMILDFCIYNLESKPMEVRYADKHGRDIWYETRNSNTNVGIRAGGTKEVPFWGQLNINIGIQHVTVKSGFVFIDGSRSLGTDHSLNGAYSAFTLNGGFGLAAGCRIIGPLAFQITADRVSRGIDSRKHPEYYQYGDNNDIGSDGYIPRDMAAYVGGAFQSENGISNDLRGWRFTFGVVLLFSTLDE